MGEKKRKRRKKSKTENVSNHKSNMAEQCSPENQTISEVIGNANEFLYGMNMSQFQNVSTPLNPHIQGIQPRTFAGHGAGAPLMQPIRHENINPSPTYMQLPQPVPLNQAQPLQTQDQHNNPVFNPMTINMIMSTIHEMNIKLEKLSLLNELNNRLLHMEQKIEKYDSEIKDIRNDF